MKPGRRDRRAFFGASDMNSDESLEKQRSKKGEPQRSELAFLGTPLFTFARPRYCGTAPGCHVPAETGARRRPLPDTCRESL